jgi:hypothetical protein
LEAGAAARARCLRAQLVCWAAETDDSEFRRLVVLAYFSAAALVGCDCHVSTACALRVAPHITVPYRPRRRRVHDVPPFSFAVGLLGSRLDATSDPTPRSAAETGSENCYVGSAEACVAGGLTRRHGCQSELVVSGYALRLRRGHPAARSYPPPVAIARRYRKLCLRFAQQRPHSSPGWLRPSSVRCSGGHQQGPNTQPKPFRPGSSCPVAPP